MLKIDKSFTAALRGGDDSRSFARAVFSFGAGLGLRVIAEGVETSDHIPRLIQLHCEWSQGYHFARPMPPAALVELLEGDRSLPAPEAAEPAVVAAVAATG